MPHLSNVLVGLPALLLFFGMMLLPDTPNSLAERERPDQARKVLERIRGSRDVEEEMRGIISAVQSSKKVQHITPHAQRAPLVVKEFHEQTCSACRGPHEWLCFRLEMAEQLCAFYFCPDTLAREWVTPCLACAYFNVKASRTVSSERRELFSRAPYSTPASVGSRLAVASTF